MSGNNKWVITKPPMKKPMTAISEGNCKLESPLMALPEVQPPAQRVPKPTRKPPTTKIKKPWRESNASHLKYSMGAIFLITNFYIAS